MSKKINHHIAKFVYYLVAAIVLFFSFMMFARVLAGCNTINKAERKVLADIESVKRVRAKTDALFPPEIEILINDTGSIRTVIKDSIVEKKSFFPVKVWKNIQFDTVINGMHFYVDSTGITVSGKYKCQNKIKYIPYENKRITNNLKDSINKYQVELAGKNGQILESRNTITEQSKTIRTQKILLYVFGSVIAVLLFLFLKDKVRLPKISKLW